jgi:hypothetical protein
MEVKIEGTGMILYEMHSNLSATMQHIHSIVAN